MRYDTQHWFLIRLECTIEHRSSILSIHAYRLHKKLYEQCAPPPLSFIFPPPPHPRAQLTHTLLHPLPLMRNREAGCSPDIPNIGSFALTPRRPGLDLRLMVVVMRA